MRNTNELFEKCRLLLLFFSAEEEHSPIVKCSGGTPMPTIFWQMRALCILLTPMRLGVLAVFCENDENLGV